MPLGDVRSVFFPYVIKKVEDGRFVFLNREYKPVGFWTRRHIKYDDTETPGLVKIRGLTAKVASKLSWNGSTDVSEIFLYNDGCIPTESPAHMKAYLEKLAILAKLKISGEPPR